MEDTYTSWLEKSTQHLTFKYRHTAKVTGHGESQQYIGDQDKQVGLEENGSFETRNKL